MRSKHGQGFARLGVCCQPSTMDQAADDSHPSTGITHADRVLDEPRDRH